MGLNDSDFVRLDHDARTTLLSHYGAQLRQWTTLLLAIVVACFTVADFRQKSSFPEPLLFVLLVVASTGIHAITRVMWYGGLCPKVVSIGFLRSYDPGSNLAYLCHMEYAVSRDFRRRGKGRISWGRLLWSLTRFPTWVALTISYSLVFYLTFLLTSGPSCILVKWFAETFHARPEIIISELTVLSLVTSILMLWKYGYGRVSPEGNTLDPPSLLKPFKRTRPKDSSSGKENQLQRTRT
jgi:hypothetical protein